MSDRASPNLIEAGLNGLKSLIGGGRDNYPLISGTNGKCQFHVDKTETNALCKFLISVVPSQSFLSRLRLFFSTFLILLE